MMNEQELNALVAILNRAPMTPAEQIWLQALIQRIAAEAQKAKQEPA